jgi:hypothetical protein
VDEGTNKVERHLETEREELGRNLDEMEARVKDMTDPRIYFDKHTFWILGAAAAAGFLLSVAVGKATANNTKESLPGRDQRDGAGSPMFGPTRANRFAETVETIFDGLVGVASGKLDSFIENAVPGFQKQYDDRQRARSA